MMAPLTRLEAVQVPAKVVASPEEAGAAFFQTPADQLEETLASRETVLVEVVVVVGTRVVVVVVGVMVVIVIAVGDVVVLDVAVLVVVFVVLDVVNGGILVFGEVVVCFLLVMGVVEGVEMDLGVLNHKYTIKQMTITMRKRIPRNIVVF